jgi:hypothetical protein
LPSIILFGYDLIFDFGFSELPVDGAEVEDEFC